LGYTNRNKCLRNVDSLIDGKYYQPELIRRISESAIGGIPFDTVMKQQMAEWLSERQEKQRVKELKERLSFVPHLHFIHERNVPSPIHVVCWVGVHHFKRLDLPQHILNVKDELTRLNVVEEFIGDYLRCPPDNRLVCGPFGVVVQILFRDDYHHSYVYDATSGAFIDSVFGIPLMDSGKLTVKGGGKLR
jgi:hypothetical protein